MNTQHNAPASAGKPAAATSAPAAKAPEQAKPDAKAADAPKADAKPAPDAPKQDAKPAEQPKADAKQDAPKADAKPADDKAADPKAAEAPAEEPKPDPFATLPRIKVADADDVLDMSGVECSPARKYERVHTDAVGAKLPVQRDWKYREAVFIPGTHKGGENGFKPGSVWGTIADIVQRAGRQGIEAQELVTLVRQRQIGNKRSHFCTALPPVGWAEGWINSAVSRNIVQLHATKKARALVVAPKGEEATPEQNKAAAKQLEAKPAAGKAADADKAKAA